MDFNTSTNPNKYYKYCFISSCRNTTYSTPEKHFICVPQDNDVRKQWCIAANCPDRRLRTISYCCEDHFNLKEDLDNYYYIKMFPNARKILKKGVVPRFNTAVNPSKLMIKNETSNLIFEQIKMEVPEESNSNDVKCVIGVKPEPVYENLCTVNCENVKVELHTELIIKKEILNDNVVEIGQIKNEILEEDISDSVIRVIPEHFPENIPDFENVNVKEELHTELIIKNEIFDKNNILESHSKKIRSGKKNHTFMCDICNKIFIKRYHLIRHRQAHSREKPFECDICNQRFKQQGHLLQHKRTHNGLKIFLCEICNKTFTQQRYLDQHKWIHSGEKRFSCDVCDKTFTKKRYLIKHSWDHS